MTTLEHAIEQIKTRIDGNASNSFYSAGLMKAVVILKDHLEAEKQQIMDAYIQGVNHVGERLSGKEFVSAEQYYTTLTQEKTKG